MVDEIDWREEDKAPEREWARYAILLADLRKDPKQGGEILRLFETGYTTEEVHRIMRVREKSRLARSVAVLHAEFLKRGKKHPQ